MTYLRDVAIAAMLGVAAFVILCWCLGKTIFDV